MPPWQIMTTPSVSSTMEGAWAWYDALKQDKNPCPTKKIPPPPYYLCYHAFHQTHGRGRHGHRWITPHHQLAMTMVIPFNTGKEHLFHSSLITGLAVTECLKKYVPQNLLCLKWPNDILLSKKKVSGILVESDLQRFPHTLAIGVGVNLSSHPSNIAMGHKNPQAPYQTTCLKDYGVSIPPNTLVKDILISFEKILSRYHTQGFGPLKDLFEEHSYQKGTLCHWYHKKALQKGRYLGIHEDGSLLMALKADTSKRLSVRQIHHGSVTFLRDSDQ